MIQRIQSVYLFLVAMLMAVSAIMASKVIWWQSLVFAILGITSLVTIFLYKNRKRQLWIVRILLLVFILVLVYIFYIQWQANNFRDKMAAVIYLITVVSGILASLAIRAIRKDEKLVRSADRLR